MARSTARPATWSSLSRPVLRDGLRVVRRDDRHLQIGLDPPDRLVIADRPGLLETLTHLDRRPPRSLRDLVDDLVEAGWIVDDAMRRRLGPSTYPPIALTVDPPLEEPALRVASVVGVRRSEQAHTRLVATVGEPRRGQSDDLVRDDVTHLWVTVLPTAVRIGPLVHPGRTSCLRCLDAHLGDLDPRRATVLQQLEDRRSTPLADLDPSLVQIGLAWAFRDLVRCFEGREPALCSATVTVTKDLEFIRRDWLRHPHCGCAWG